MANENYIVVDKIKWFVYTSPNGLRHAQPLCPEHHLRLKPNPGYHYSSVRRGNVRDSDSEAIKLSCDEGHEFVLARNFGREESYVLDRLDALVFEKATYIYLDDIAIPVAKDELKDKDSPIWVRAKVTESKSGLRLIVWAGDRSEKSKTQLFVEPEIARLSFDQNDDHPTQVFAKVEATFSNGRRAVIKGENAS